MADQEHLDFIFDTLEANKVTKSDQPVSQPGVAVQPIASPDTKKRDVEYLFDTLERNEAKELTSATFADVAKSGGLRAIAGPAQAFLALVESSAESAGNPYPENLPTVEEFTQMILQMEGNKDMGAGQRFVRDTIANVIPIALEIGLTRGATIPQTMKVTGGVGLGAGYTQFVEDPAQAKTGSTARMTNAALSALIGAIAVGGTSLFGRGIDYLRGARGTRQSANVDIRPDVQTRMEGAATIEQARDAGIVLTPGQATGNRGLQIQEMSAGGRLSQQLIKDISDTIASNQKAADSLIDDLYSVLLPEGKATIHANVSALYEKSGKQLLRGDSLDAFNDLRAYSPRGTDKLSVIEKTIANITNNPATNRAYAELPKNSIGRANLIVRNLQAQINAAREAGTTDFIPLKNLRENLLKILDEASPEYALARQTSQREKTAQEVIEALRSDKGSAVVPYANSAERFVGAFDNVKAKEKLFEGISNLPNKAMQAEARAKFELLIKLLPKVASQQKFLEQRLAQSGERVLQQRASPEIGFLFSALNAINTNNDTNFLRFILDPSKTSARLKELNLERNTASEEFLKKAGIVFSEIIDDYATENVAGMDFAENLELSGLDRQAMGRSTDSAKAKAYRNLLQSGRLDEFMAKNPEAYKILRNAGKAQAIV